MAATWPNGILKGNGAINKQLYKHSINKQLYKHTKKEEKAHRENTSDILDKLDQNIIINIHNYTVSPTKGN